MKKIEFKKPQYFLGTYPNKDWPRIFVVFIIVLIIVVFVGTSKYFDYMNTTPTQNIDKTFSGNATTSTDVIFEKYSQKVEKFESSKDSINSDIMVPDPSI